MPWFPVSTWHSLPRSRVELLCSGAAVRTAAVVTWCESLCLNSPPEEPRFFPSAVSGKIKASQPKGGFAVCSGLPCVEQALPLVDRRGITSSGFIKTKFLALKPLVIICYLNSYLVWRWWQLQATNMGKKETVVKMLLHNTVKIQKKMPAQCLSRGGLWFPHCT